MVTNYRLVEVSRMHVSYVREMASAGNLVGAVSENVVGRIKSIHAILPTSVQESETVLSRAEDLGTGGFFSASAGRDSVVAWILDQLATGGANIGVFDDVLWDVSTPHGEELPGSLLVHEGKFYYQFDRSIDSRALHKILRYADADWYCFGVLSKHAALFPHDSESSTDFPTWIRRVAEQAVAIITVAYDGEGYLTAMIESERAPVILGQ